MSAQELTYY